MNIELVEPPIDVGRLAAEQQAGIDTLLAELTASSAADMACRLRFMYRVMALPLGDMTSHLQGLLSGACYMLNMDCASLVWRESAFTHQVAVAVDGSLQDQMDAQELVISQIVEAGAQIIVQDVNNSPFTAATIVYNGLRTQSYMGIPLKVNGKIVGAISLYGAAPKSLPCTREDVETLELLADGAAKIMEIQAFASRRPAIQSNNFATAGIKSFEEYREQGTIPQLYGVPGRVIEVLQRRIGSSPLAIDYIADELNLSKRTLQRRLQQQDFSFAQLRDQVRFHHAMNYLIEQHMSIDAISSSLDFSDRTSFTNAFKRWTGLSPSTFRKLFRDYN